MNSNLTPREIVEALDSYIIGQPEAKRTVAIALRNRWRRQQVTGDLQDEILPSNIIMMGPTGVGKTEIARRLAKLVDAPFIKVEATKFTEVGYVGRDVESMIRELADRAVRMVRQEHEQLVQERAHELARERLLDVMLTPKTVKPSDSTNNGQPEDDQMEESSTRSKFRKRLEDGRMSDREVEIEVNKDNSNSMLQVFGPLGMEEMGMNIQEMIGGIGGKQRKKRRVKISEAQELLAKEEASKLIDMESVTQEALKRVENSGIVFIDEIDKVASRTVKSGGGPDVSREGVQRDLLPLVEGATVNTKHGMVRTDHILFIASGAFHVAKPSDLIPEMQGRFPIRVEMHSLTEEEFYLILTQPKNALLKQYHALLQAENVELEFTDDAVRRIAHTAAKVNDEVENIGARRLHTIMTTLLEDLLFESDGTNPLHIQLDADEVDARLDSIARNRDLSQYIL
ncbi:MAG: ATP-dependent protease ATPase subunit HslU [Bacteroidetes bacterium]|nr:ATP-dependent protease ATPase subunit HslU [Bacteroidota bacterium]MCY4233457.1 ATP-dependent protease ATPase subunit HslU [Bacteroidota bacterium]